LVNQLNYRLRFAEEKRGRYYPIKEDTLPCQNGLYSFEGSGDAVYGHVDFTNVLPAISPAR
jgi:hypothetical protein